ncbi:hypothetical protein GCM10022270_19670 [Terriglobus aquaticus]
MLGLFVSGVTAFPLETELRGFVRLLHRPALVSFAMQSHLLPWFERVLQALTDANQRYPFLAYGTDWLAFAHLVLAVLFIGPFVDPVRNKWVLQFGLIACAGVLPLTFIAGPIRTIPFGWSLIDSSFGVFGCVPLVVALRQVRRLERQHL